MQSPIIIDAFGDNLIYVLEYDPGKALVVDPGEAAGVVQILSERNLNLTHILCTHHHSDHTDGIGQIKRATECEVVASDVRRISVANHIVKDGDVLTLGGIEIQAIATPGHTATSMCYHVHQIGNQSNGILFTGDTLFVGGCGRPFECSADMMWRSLQRLAALPDTTLVYCGHEYTIENYEFALQIEPDSQTVRQRIQQIIGLQQQTGHTVPSTIEQEKQTNCFLRADSAEIRSALSMPNAPAAQVFAELRSRKNRF